MIAHLVFRSWLLKLWQKGHCPAVNINQTIIPQTEVAKYLGLHFDCGLNWKEHIARKRKQIDLKTKEIIWLLVKKSHLSTENKLLNYKAVIKPIWSYGIELWGCTSQVQHNHHAEITVQNSQSHSKSTLVYKKSHSTYRLQHPLRKWCHPWKNQ